MSMERQKKEQPNTYMVQDHSNEEELLRLQLQDQLVTTGMGGVLPEQTDPEVFKRVLDIGCGTGGWLIALAQQFPALSPIGIDISVRMLEYARQQAAAAHVDDRVEFHRMDALLMLEFPYAFFDLVNLRLGSSFLRTWDWSKLLGEALRVTCDNGIIRVTECEVSPLNNSPALTQLQDMFMCALFRAGHHFAYGSTGVIDQLPQLLTRYGYKQVQVKNYALELHAGTPEGESWLKGVTHIFRTIRPFLEKWGCAPKEYDAIYQQALHEVQQPDFHATWNVSSAWGKKIVL